ncbi:efflux RND transporter permease subunit [Haliangium sp.]|uniref:efflux RND transporter permease subunit n=1 Tax=Haliangium sp. TaxID=2663208 RepID=UPI003D0F65BD
MTDKALQELYGLDRDQRPPGLLSTLLHLLLRHATAVVAVMAVLTAGSAYLASQLELVTDFSQLIPETARSVTDQREGEPYLGNTSLLVVVVEAAGEGAGERARQAVAALSERLAADPAFDFVLHRFDRDFFERNALLYLSTEQLEDLYRRLDDRVSARVLAETGLFVDLTEGLDDDDDDDEPEPDILDPEVFRSLYFADRSEMETGEYLTDEAGTTYLLLARPVAPPVDIENNRALLKRVQDHVAALALTERYGPGIEVGFSGNYWSTVEENDAVKRDLSKAGLISAGLLVLAVLFYFRRLRALLFVFVPLLAGVVIMMGYVKLAVGHLNTITGFCFALFMGLSIDFAIHFLARYDEERGRERSVFDALLLTYRQTGRASISAAATSSVGFLALMAADFEGFREFGIIAGGGIVICLVVIAVLLPAIIALSVRFVRERRFALFTPEHASTLRQPSRTRAVVAVGVVLIALLGWRATQVQWEDDFRNLRGGTAANLEIAERVQGIMGRSTQPAVRIANTLGEAAALAQACNDERDARQGTTTVQLCLSLADFLPEDQADKLTVIGRIKALLSEQRLELVEDDGKRKELVRLRDQAPTAPLTEADLPQEIVMGFVGAGGGKYLMKAYPVASTWLASNNIRFADELMQGDDVSSSDIGPIGSSMIMADLMRVMKRDSRDIMLIAVVAVFAVLLILFRSVTRALACYVPVLVSVSCALGAMEILGMRLGLFNMIVLPSLVGLGVDNNIHLFHRYTIEGRGSWPYTIKTTGAACLMAAVTTMAGFAGLLVASHRGLSTIGDLAILGIATATAISLVLVPAAMSLVERRVRGTGFGVLPRHEFAGNRDDSADASLQSR